MSEFDGLRLIASAIAGRDVEVAAAEGPAWTDGATITLDATAPKSEIVASLSVQASLLAQRSLEPDVVGELVRRPAVAQRYLAIEGHRALAANTAVLPRRVLAIVDHEVARRVESPEDSLRLARAKTDIVEPPPCFGTIQPRRVRSVLEQEGAHSSATQSIEPAPAAITELDDDDDGEGLGSLLSSPVGGGGPFGRLLRKLLSPMRTGGSGPPGGDAPLHTGRASGRGASFVSSNTPMAALADAPATRSGVTYPEWDVNRRRYRPDWCTVIESDAPTQAGAPTTIPDVTTLRRSLARLGIGIVHTRRRRQGEDVDIDAVVDARVQWLAGVASDDALYVESVRRSRDLSVLVLLDVSGSAGEPGTGGRRVHDHQQLLTLQLTAALHDLGDRVAFYAFNSRGARRGATDAGQELRRRPRRARASTRAQSYARCVHASRGRNSARHDDRRHQRRNAAATPRRRVRRFRVRPRL